MGDLNNYPTLFHRIQWRGSKNNSVTCYHESRRVLGGENADMQITPYSESWASVCCTDVHEKEAIIFRKGRRIQNEPVLDVTLRTLWSTTVYSSNADFYQSIRKEFIRGRRRAGVAQLSSLTNFSPWSWICFLRPQRWQDFLRVKTFVPSWLSVNMAHPASD